MGKDVPFEADNICDECGALGAFDFYGDCLCPKCVGVFPPREEDDDPECE